MRRCTVPQTRRKGRKSTSEPEDIGGRQFLVLVQNHTTGGNKRLRQKNTDGDLCIRNVPSVHEAQKIETSKPRYKLHYGDDAS